MTCKDNNIKELLPAYAEQILDQTDKQRVEEHLTACEDCMTEFSLLRMMTDETAPGPGEAFWNEMPHRIYRAVQAQKANKRSLYSSWLANRLTLPRWVFGSATVGIALVIALFTIHSSQKAPTASISQEYEFADELMVANGVHINELDQDQLDTVAAWAGNELASISKEAEPVMVNGRGADIYEELAALNTKEIERLSQMIEKR